MELRNSEAKIDELTQAYKSLVKSTTAEGTAVTKTLRPWKDLFALTGSKDDEGEDTSMMDEESTVHGEDLTAKEMLDKIRELEGKIVGLEDVTTKFRQRMTIKDPVMKMHILMNLNIMIRSQHLSRFSKQRRTKRRNYHQNIPLPITNPHMKIISTQGMKMVLSIGYLQKMLKDILP